MAYLLMSHNKDGVPLADLSRLASGCRWARALNRSGTLVFEVPLLSSLLTGKAGKRVLHKHNIIVLYSSYWTQPWKGFITDLEFNSDTVTVTAVSIEQMLGRRRSDVAIYEEVTPGEAFTDLIAQANAHGHTGIYVGTVYSGGKPYTVSVHRENVYDKIVEMVEALGLEWQTTFVSPSVSYASLYEKVGRDLTDKILVLSAHDTSEPVAYTESMAEHANRIYAVGALPEGEEVPEGEDEYDYRPTVIVEDGPSIDEYDLTEDTVEYSDTEDDETLREMALKDLAVRRFEKQMLPISIHNRRDIWGRFDVGDIVAVLQPHYAFGGFVVPVRVLGIEVDETASVLTLVSEVVQGTQAQSLLMYKNAAYGTVSGRGYGGPEPAESPDPTPPPETPASVYGVAVYGQSRYTALLDPKDQ